jgi:hypothetical protein
LEIPFNGANVKSTDAQLSGPTNPFVMALVAARIVPEQCRRIVIDCEAGQPIKIYFEVFADSRLNELSALAVSLPEGIEIKKSAG